MVTTSALLFPFLINNAINLLSLVTNHYLNNDVQNCMAKILAIYRSYIFFCKQGSCNVFVYILVAGKITFQQNRMRETEEIVYILVYIVLFIGNKIKTPDSNKVFFSTLQLTAELIRVDET